MNQLTVSELRLVDAGASTYRFGLLSGTVGFSEAAAPDYDERFSFTCSFAGLNLVHLRCDIKRGGFTFGGITMDQWEGTCRLGNCRFGTARTLDVNSYRFFSGLGTMLHIPVSSVSDG